jgi:hypothetical protein
MATSKDPNKGENEENASEPQHKSMFDFYKRQICGRPKKCANLATDKVVVVRKMPKKQPRHLTTCKAQPKGAATNAVPKLDDEKKQAKDKLVTSREPVGSEKGCQRLGQEGRHGTRCTYLAVSLNAVGYEEYYQSLFDLLDL